MSQVVINSSRIGDAFREILLSSDIQPGDEPSYQLCKLLYEVHPVAKKMVDAPIMMAQSQKREINIQKGPEDKVRDAFLNEWEKIGADRYIANTTRLARIYGVSAIAIKIKGEADDKPLSLDKLADANISFSVFDPLNIAGSMVLNLQPNSFDFLKSSGIVVQGQQYDISRTKVAMNEEPIYISYTSSAFGFVGRSVYQRSLFPLKTFIQSMITDDMIVVKSGVIIAKMKTFGAIVDNIMQMAAGIKRSILQQAQTGNVISVHVDEAIETLNMQNIDAPYGMARKNILENIALSADMPAKILNSETFAEGFGEGTEDAQLVKQFVDRMRITMDPLYRFFDKIVQYRAWNRNFFETIQNLHPGMYKNYDTAFREWQNSFVTRWPNLDEEPDSEKVKVDDVKLKALVAIVEVLLPIMDPPNKANLVGWLQDNTNDFEMLFGSPLMIDLETLADYEPHMLAAGGAGAGPQEPKPEAPFSSKDSDDVRHLAMLQPKHQKVILGALREVAGKRM